MLPPAFVHYTNLADRLSARYRARVYESGLLARDSAGKVRAMR